MIGFFFSFTSHVSVSHVPMASAFEYSSERPRTGLAVPVPAENTAKTTLWYNRWLHEMALGLGHNQQMPAIRHSSPTLITSTWRGERRRRREGLEGRRQELSWTTARSHPGSSPRWSSPRWSKSDAWVVPGLGSFRKEPNWPGDRAWVYWSTSGVKAFKPSLSKSARFWAIDVFFSVGWLWV